LQLIRIISNHCEEALIKDHNDRFNPRGVKRGGDASDSERAPEEPAAKKLCVDKTMALTDEALIEEKFLGPCPKNNPWITTTNSTVFQTYSNFTPRNMRYMFSLTGFGLGHWG